MLARRFAAIQVLMNSYESRHLASCITTLDRNPSLRYDSNSGPVAQLDRAAVS